MSKKTNQEQPKDNDFNLDEYLAADAELKELRKEQGVEVKEGRISRFIPSLFERSDARKRILVKKKTYLLLALFTGWMGGHRFYAKQYVLGVLYLLFFWTGFPTAMTIVDLLQVIPMPADEDGKILV